MMNKNKDSLLVKILFKSGHGALLYSNEETFCEMVSHPKFLNMRGEDNDVFVSLEDIVAFEVMNDRKEAQEIEEGKKTA
jgi:hypothetical protein